jgi:hypothetical protein
MRFRTGLAGAEFTLFAGLSGHKAGQNAADKAKDSQG